MYLYYITGLQMVNPGLPAHNEFFSLQFQQRVFCGGKIILPILKNLPNWYTTWCGARLFAVSEISVPHGFLITASSIFIFHYTSQ